MAIKFKTKEELHEYFENIGIEYRYGCFSEKKPEVCHLLGEYLDVIKGDFQKAAKIFKANCEEYNHPRSCHAIGSYAITGKGQEKQSLDNAYNYYMKGCEGDFASSCFNAGIISLKKKTPNKERDYTKGLELIDKACTLNNMQACYYISGLYIRGSEENQIPKDMKQAFRYSEKACNLGNVYACANLSLMYKKGDGVEKNQKMSEKYSNLVREMKADLERIDVEQLFTKSD